MYLFVTSTLVFDIIAYDFFIPIIPDRVYIVTTCPKFPSPEHSFHFGKSDEYLFGCDAFRRLHYSAR